MSRVDHAAFDAAIAAAPRGTITRRGARLLGVLSLGILTSCGASKEPVVEPVNIAVAPPPVAIAAEPAEPTYREAVDEPFRQTAPDLGAISPFVTPVVKSRALRNGVRVLLMDRPGSPFFRVDLVVRTAGTAAPLGAATLVADSLRGGTTTRSERQIGDDIENALAQYSAWADATCMTASLTARTADADTLIALLADLTLHPILSAQFVDRDRDWYAAQRDHDNDVPKIIAMRVLPMALTHSSAPEDVRPELRGSDFRALDRDAVLRTYETAFVPSRATLIVLGDVTEAAILPKLERQFGVWPTRPTPKPTQNALAKGASSAKAPPSSKAPPSAKAALLSTQSPAGPTPRIVLVDRPQAQQSYVLFGGRGPGRASPELATEIVLEAVVESPGGRIMRAMRDEQKLTWGASTRLDIAPEDTRLSWGAEVPAGRTGDALRELDKQLQHFREDEAPAAEISDAVLQLTRAWPASFVTLDTIASRLQGLAAHSLPETDLATLFSRQSAVTAADVKRVGAKIFDPMTAKYVVVGDAASVRPQLEALGWGTIERRDVNGAVLR